jgi:hypothetical protein
MEIPQVLGAIPWFGWVAIVAIVCSTITGALHRAMSHRERMAMIQNGMNPDALASCESDSCGAERQPMAKAKFGEL